MMDSKVEIKIPQTLIEDTIRMEMIKSMPNTEAMVQKIVEVALTSKKDSYSSTPTYFQQAVNDMIIGEAKKIFQAWLEENRSKIADALVKYLNSNKQKRLTEFAEKIASNINSYGIHVSLDIKG